MTGIHLNHRRICDQPCSADKQKQCHIPESSSRHFPDLQVNCCQKCNKTQYNKAERDSHNYQGTLDMVQGDCTSASDIVLCNLILSPLGFRISNCQSSSPAVRGNFPVTVQLGFHLGISGKCRILILIQNFIIQPYLRFMLCTFGCYGFPCVFFCNIVIIEHQLLLPVCFYYCRKGNLCFSPFSI